MTRTQLTVILASSLTAAVLVGCSSHAPTEGLSKVDVPTDAPVPEEPTAPELTEPEQELADLDPVAAETAAGTVQAAEGKVVQAKPAVRTRADAEPLARGSEDEADDFFGGGVVGGIVGAAAPEASLMEGRRGPATPRPAPVQPVLNEGGFRDYGVNGFVQTAQDRLSTFAIDVDTASYTMARKSLNSGYLPPGGGVRVEEFVNYMPYEYPQPKADRPFSVDFEAAPSPWDERLTLLRVGVQGKVVTQAERKPVHLTFLVDTSGSMRSHDKLDLVKRSLLMLTRELQEGDTVAIATYAGSTRVVLEPTDVTNADRIQQSLGGLTAGGSTAMDSGINLAYRLANSAMKPGSVNRVIVCSDGDANVGRTSPDVLASEIRAYAEKGITLTTLGVGNGNYKDVMMERLANQGDGNYFYIDSDKEAKRVLVDKLSGTLEVIAKDVKIQVEFDPDHVSSYRLVGYENRDVADRDFRNDKVDAGEIGAGHQVTALYEVVLSDHARGDFATVRVRHKQPGPDAPAAEGVWTVSTRDVGSHFAEASGQFRMASAAGYFAEVLRGSPHVSEISLSQVAQLAERAQRASFAEDQELVDLIWKASRLRGEGAVSFR